MNYLRSVVGAVTALVVFGLSLATSLATPSQDVVLSGRLLTESNSRGGLAVRLHCPRVQGQTRATRSGHFAVRLTRPSDDGFMSAPSAPNRRGRNDTLPFQSLRNSLECTLEVLDSGVVLKQFRLAIPPRAQTIDIGDLEVPTQVGPAPGHGPTVHWSSLTAPAEALSAFEQVRYELDKSQPDLKDAKRLLKRALRLDPEMAEAWELLGIVEFAGGSDGSARSDFEKVLALDDTSCKTYTFLAQLDMREQKWQAALEHCERALEIDPNWPQAEYLKAFAAYNLGDFDAARLASRRVHTSGEGGRFADLAVVDALLLAREGRTAEASALLRSFLEENPGYRKRPALEDQLAMWEDSTDGEARECPKKH